MTKILRSALLSAATFVGIGFAGLGTSSPAMACPADSPYIGSICYMATSFCPYGFVKADGSVLSINSQQALFSLIGNLWGGSVQQGTFALPDLRGRVPVGAGQGPGLVNVQRAQVFGLENMTLTTNNIAPHVHPATISGSSGTSGTVTIAIPVVGTAGSATTNIPANTTNLAGPVYNDPNSGNPEAVNAYSTATPTTTLKPFTAPFAAGALSGVTIGPNTGGLPFSLRNPSVGLTACIATMGIYPTQP